MHSDEAKGQPGLGRYVDAPRLLEALFEEDSRPSLRALRNWQASNVIPHVKIGRLIFFDPVAVKLALERRRTVKAKA